MNWWVCDNIVHPAHRKQLGLLSLNEPQVFILLRHGDDIFADFEDFKNNPYAETLDNAINQKNIVNVSVNIRQNILRRSHQHIWNHNISLELPGIRPIFHFYMQIPLCWSAVYERK